MVKLLSPVSLFTTNLSLALLLAITMLRKRPKKVEFIPQLEAPAGPTPNVTTHHTHYEHQRRPVKSTVTLDIPEKCLEVVESTSGVDFQPVILNDGGLEQLEFEGQRREIHGLPLLGGMETLTAEDTSFEVSRKKH